jgi:hypothetical protein
MELTVQLDAMLMKVIAVFIIDEFIVIYCFIISLL